MTVCVAISVKNGERFFARAIESVLAQERVDLELRIYDNGSTDGSVELARGYLGDGRVSVTVNERDLNYYGSLNRALAETSSRYFVAFASDDVMLPGNLARKVEALERTGAGLAHSRALLIDETDATTAVAGVAGLPELTAAPQFFGRLAPVNILSCQSVVARTSALRWIGGFDESEWYCGDWLAWMLLSLRVGVVSIEEPLVANRVHAGAATTATNRGAAFASHCRAALERALSDEYFPGDWGPLRPRLRAQLAVHTAHELAKFGHLRVAGGEAAYACAAEALACPELRDGVAGLHGQLVAAAGLTPPSVPFHVVARAPCEAGPATALARECERLARLGLVASLALAADADAVEAAGALLGPLFDGFPLDVDLVGGPLEALLAPGRVLAAPAGSPDVEAAEAAGIPALPYDLPLAPCPWLAEEAA